MKARGFLGGFLAWGVVPFLCCRKLTTGSKDSDHSFGFLIILKTIP